MNERNQKRYEAIIKEEIGKKKYYQIERVKDCQCYECAKYKNKKCLLEFNSKNKCKNFELKGGEKNGK